MDRAKGNRALAGDAVDHPQHYTLGGIEVIDAIEAWTLGFHTGNAVKYIARAKHKGSEIEDLKKARWYLDREIQRLEKEESHADSEAIRRNAQSGKSG